MFKINKEEPPFFKEVTNKIKIKDKNSNAWHSDDVSDIRTKLRQYILNKEQNNCCAYCEREINSSTSNIDHFKTRNHYPQYTLEYDNLLVSCNTKDRCSDYKDKNITKAYYGNIVNPTIEDPNQYFDYLITGEILPKENYKKAKDTINIFKLDDKILTRERYRIAQTLINIKLPLDEICEIFKEFNSFIKNIHPKLQQGK